MPSAIGSNNAGGSNISSPAGAGILPPQSGMTDVVGIASVLGSTGTSGVGAIGGSSTNPGSQFLSGSSGFSSSISQLAGNNNTNSFGLGGQNSVSGRFGTSQSGFTDSLSQGEQLATFVRSEKLGFSIFSDADFNCLSLTLYFQRILILHSADLNFAF